MCVCGGETNQPKKSRIPPKKTAMERAKTTSSWKRWGIQPIFIYKSMPSFSWARPIHTKCVGMGALSPTLVDKAAEAFSEWCMDAIAMSCPTPQALRLPLSELHVHRQAPRRGCLLSRHCSIQLTGQKSALLLPISHWNTADEAA